MISGVKHIAPESFPLQYNDNLAKFAIDETIVYGDIIRAQLGNYLHNLTVQSWLESPYYIFNNIGRSPATRGMFHAATTVGKRTQAGFCDLSEYSQARGTNFPDLASANKDYFSYSLTQSICMPIKNQSAGTCSPYFYLINNSTAFDRTIDAVSHHRSNGGSCRPDGNVAQELYETDYDGRKTRVLRSIR